MMSHRCGVIKDSRLIAPAPAPAPDQTILKDAWQQVTLFGSPCRHRGNLVLDGFPLWSSLASLAHRQRRTMASDTITESMLLHLCTERTALLGRRKKKASVARSGLRGNHKLISTRKKYAIKQLPGTTTRMYHARNIGGVSGEGGSPSPAGRKRLTRDKRADERESNIHIFGGSQPPKE